MTRALLAVALVALVAVFAAIADRRRRRPIAGPAGHHVPTAVDRADFPGRDRSWLVVVFTSATCSSCAETWERARHVASGAVAAHQSEVGREPGVHERYGIDAVPTTVICDDEGVVRASFLGPVSATHLWGELAELREPGSLPAECGVADDASV
jgi:hypothetical protein